MKPATLLFCLFAPAALVAQSATDLVARANRPPGMECPIGMHARHDFSFRKDLVDGERPQARDLEKPGEPAMQVRLTLTNSDERQITKARITVHGTRGNWRTIPVRDAAGSFEITRTVEAVFEAGDGRDANSFVAVRGFTSITSIVLDGVTFSDGSTWKTIDGGACRVVPDPLMLVAAH